MRRAYAMLGLGTAVLLCRRFPDLRSEEQQGLVDRGPVGEATFLVPAHDGYEVAECLVLGPIPAARR